MCIVSSFFALPFLSFSFFSIYSSPRLFAPPPSLSLLLCVSLDSSPWNSHWHTSSTTSSFPSRANLLPLITLLPLRPSPTPSCHPFVLAIITIALALQNNLRCTSVDVVVVIIVFVVVNVDVVSIIAIITRIQRCACRGCALQSLQGLSSNRSPSRKPRDLPIRLTFVYFRWQRSCTLHSMIADDDELFPKRYSHVYIATLFPFSWDRTRCSGLFVRYCTVNSGDFYRRERARLVPLVDP